jgi:hypothetical protein
MQNVDTERKESAGWPTFLKAYTTCSDVLRSQISKRTQHQCLISYQSCLQASIYVADVDNGPGSTEVTSRYVTTTNPEVDVPLAISMYFGRGE